MHRNRKSITKLLSRGFVNLALIGRKQIMSNQTRNLSAFLLYFLIFIFQNNCGRAQELISNSEREDSKIPMNIEQISPNHFLLTYEILPEMTVNEIRIGATVRNIGTVARLYVYDLKGSVDLFVDVGTVYDFGIWARYYDYDNSQYSGDSYNAESQEIYSEIPLDFPEQSLLTYEVEETITSEDIKEYFVTLTWTKPTDEGTFAGYELWNINHNGLGYYSDYYQDLSDDYKVFETNNIDATSHSFTEQYSLTYDNKFVVYLIHKNGNRTPSEYIEIPD